MREEHECGCEETNVKLMNPSNDNEVILRHEWITDNTLSKGGLCGPEKEKLWVEKKGKKEKKEEEGKDETEEENEEYNKRTRTRI